MKKRPKGFEVGKYHPRQVSSEHLQAISTDYSDWHKVVAFLKMHRERDKKANK